MWSFTQHSKSKKSHKHSKSIEELRRERKKREEAERIRTTALLNGTPPDDDPGNHGDASSSGRWADNMKYAYTGWLGILMIH